MAHFLPLLPNESHKEREASIFQRSHQPGCSISLWWGSSEVFLFFLPGRHSDYMWTQEARELDRQDAESLIVERLPFSDSTKSACLNYLAELKKKKTYFSTVAVLVALHHPLLLFRSSRSSRMLMDSGSLRVWVTSGWCRILKPGRHLQMSPKNTVCCSPAMGVSRWGRFHWRLWLPWYTPAASAPFNLTFSPSFFLRFISVLLSVNACFSLLMKTRW